MSAIIGIAALGSFTFHYVSINTMIEAIHKIQDNFFTFHYVSINTAMKNQYFQTCSLYIPLCFY